MSDDHTHLAKDALHFHAKGRPGKLSIQPTKPLATQRDLSLAYSPGVAAPCEAIVANPDAAYDYTSKGNIVAVISNGTAVLGLGDLGALASKPVMEGKAVLFKRFADIDGIDIEVTTKDPDTFITCVENIAHTFGGINLEDIRAPECFYIEQELQKRLDIPVFHDDQHGTAVILAAALMNALDITGKRLDNIKVVANGAGAAAIACMRLLVTMGLPRENITVVDREGVIYKGRTASMNPWKEEFAAHTKDRTLAEAMRGADVFVGLSVKGAVTQEMILSMGKAPLVFAMANPDPEIEPAQVLAVRPDALVATGRSDYPNQVNNVLGFPYIFRGALDVRARAINEEMKLAAARALAELARQDVPDEVDSAYAGRRLQYGPGYIIPVPFDPRLISVIPPAVAKAAIETGVARKTIKDFEEYRHTLGARLDPTVSTLQLITQSIKSKPQRVIFAEGEEEKALRAAIAFHTEGYGKSVLIAQENSVHELAEKLGLTLPKGLVIHNAALSDHNKKFVDFIYEKLQRHGYLYRDCQRLVHHDRNTFGACMLAFGEADAMVTGLTRTTNVAFAEISRVLSPRAGARAFGLSICVMPQHTVFIADTMVHESPTAEILADIAVQVAERARILGHEPRVAFVSASNFGNPWQNTADHVREAVRILEQKNVSFEFDGDMSVQVALNPDVKKLYPFCRLTRPANILIMPELHSANISSQLLQELGGGTKIGPLLMGLEKPVQIARMTATVSELVNLAAFAAHDALLDSIGRKKKNAHRS